MDRQGFGSATVAARLGYKDDGATVRRWLRGDVGPDQERREQLAAILNDPALLTAWDLPATTAQLTASTPTSGPEDTRPELADDADGEPETVEEAATLERENGQANVDLAPEIATDAERQLASEHPPPPEVSTPPRQADRAEDRGRHTRMLVVVAAAVVALVALVGLAAWVRSGASGMPDAPSTSAQATPPGTAAFSAKVDGSGPGTDPTTPVSLWSRPSTSTGCELSRCIEGTRALLKVGPGTEIEATCRVEGQRIRNGMPGGTGFYEDNRWLRVVSVDNVPLAEPSYISNVWLARDKLPVSLRTC